MRSVQENQLSNQSQQKESQRETCAQKVLSKMSEAHIAQRDETIVKRPALKFEFVL